MNRVREQIRCTLLNEMLRQKRTVGFVARRIGRTPSNIADLLSGVRAIELADASAIAAALGGELVPRVKEKP